MKDEQILKKLYELQGLKSPESDEYIMAWINTTKTDMADASLKSIGFGDTSKAIKKILSSAKKKKPDIAYVLKTSKKHDFIITDGIQALHIKDDLGLPTTANQIDFADRMLNVFDGHRQNCKDAVPKPNRSTLDSLIKYNKALPKDKREPIVKYNFGDRLPAVDSELLLNISACFPTAVCYVNKSAGALSPVYFKYEKTEGILMPLRKG